MDKAKYYRKTELNEPCWKCGYKGEITLLYISGGIFYENDKRYNVRGECPKCKNIIINFHITIEDIENKKEIFKLNQ